MDQRDDLHSSSEPTPFIGGPCSSRGEEDGDGESIPPDRELKRGGNRGGADGRRRGCAGGRDPHGRTPLVNELHPQLIALLYAADRRVPALALELALRVAYHGRREVLDALLAEGTVEEEREDEGREVAAAEREGNFVYPMRANEMQIGRVSPVQEFHRH